MEGSSFGIEADDKSVMAFYRVENLQGIHKKTIFHNLMQEYVTFPLNHKL